VLIVWTDDPANLVATVNDFEERLIRLLWRSAPRPALSSAHGSSALYPDSASGHSVMPSSHSHARIAPRDEPFNSAHVTEKGAPFRKEVTKRTWYGRKKTMVVEAETEEELEYGDDRRPTMLYAPFYNGIAAALSFGELRWLWALGVRC
jgi:hypothetical protein